MLASNIQAFTASARACALAVDQRQRLAGFARQGHAVGGQRFFKIVTRAAVSTRFNDAPVKGMQPGHQIGPVHPAHMAYAHHAALHVILTASHAHAVVVHGDAQHLGAA